MTDNTATANDMNYFQSSRPAQSFIAAAKALVLKPRDFFASMPVAVFYGESLFFASIVIFILTFLAVPFYSLGMLFMLPFTWGAILIGMWLLSAYMSWSVKAFAGCRLSSAGAFQISAYAMLPMMFAGLSWAGVLAFVWCMYLLWLGLSVNCRISGVRAAYVLIVPLLTVAMIGGAMTFALGHLRITT